MVYGVFCYRLASVMLLSVAVKGQQISFQEQNVDPSIKNRNNREPIYAPSRCPENELFYPGDQPNDWICDCRPAYLFEPLSDKCHAAYRRGPCLENEYLVLAAGAAIPRCVPNPCHKDGLVPWAAGCVQLDSSAPCVPRAGRALLLGVNPSTLALECGPVALSTRMGEEDAPSVSPPKGGRRSVGSAGEASRISFPRN